LALPSDSYLNDYFDHLDVYLDVGPPVYFVSHDLNMTKRPGQQELCGRFTTCDEFSVANVLEAELKRPESL
jgi:Niemann-Pick C1 protein